MSKSESKPQGSRGRTRGRPNGGYHHRNRAVPIPEGHMIVGRITGAHGLRGEVKVELHTDFPERFAPGRQVLVGAELAAAEIASSRPHKGIILVRFAEIVNRTQAEGLRGEWLYIPDEAAMALDEDAFWVHDIIGLTAQTEEGRVLGRVVDVLFTGANEVYVVQTEVGVNRGRDLLLPALADVIRGVDLEGRRMTVRLMPGMLDE